MFSPAIIRFECAPRVLAGVLLLVAGAQADVGVESTSPELTVRVVAEVQVRVVERATQRQQMMPADKLVSGDLVYYTLEVRNGGSRSLQSPSVVQAVPAYTVYVANSAAGPGCEITFSVDGGRSFARPEDLKIAQPDGAQRAALARDYTHIRFRMASLVKTDAVAFLRFRARVK